MSVQSILDIYSVGRLEHIEELPSFLLSVTDFPPVAFKRFFVETTHGMFLLLSATNTGIHKLWWSEGEEMLVSQTRQVLGIHFMKSVKNGCGLHIIHKLHKRWILFEM